MWRLPRSLLIATASVGAATLALSPSRIASSSPPAPADPPGILREHRTQQPFLQSRKLPGAGPGSTFTLLGTNVRCMLGWCRLPAARGYAFALYADARALGAAARAAASQPAEADSLLPLLDAAQRGEAGELALVLSMARPIAGSHLTNGLQKSVLQRVKALAARAGGSTAGEASSALAAEETREVMALAQAFARLPDFAPGDEVAFVWRAGGALAVSVRGELLPVRIAQPRVARALFDTYCGPLEQSPKPVSTRGKQTFERNVKAIAAALPPASLAEGNPAALARVHEIVVAEHNSRVK